MDSMDFETARQQMIGQQLRAWDVLDERVLEVMAALPREHFVPPGWRALAYADTEIPLGHGKSLAPPKIQGRALQALLPQADEQALEIGSGTGYLSACLGCLSGSVVSVELHRSLLDAAGRNLAALGIHNVELREGDGLAMELPAEFDVICVNGSLPAADPHLPRLQRLLRPGGRLFAVTGQPPVMAALRITRSVDTPGEGPADAQWTRDSLFETCLPPLEKTGRDEEFVF